MIINLKTLTLRFAVIKKKNTYTLNFSKLSKVVIQTVALL